MVTIEGECYFCLTYEAAVDCEPVWRKTPRQQKIHRLELSYQMGYLLVYHGRLAALC